MKQEISKIILEDVKDPRIGFVTVTRVHVTNDLRRFGIDDPLLRIIGRFDISIWRRS